MTLKHKIIFGQKLGLSPAQASFLARLGSPEKIQDFLTEKIRINFEPGGDTVLSAAEALRQGHAHCIEAAFIAAAALWMQGEKPLLMDLRASKHDDDHVVALFRRGGCWGAISMFPSRSRWSLASTASSARCR